MPLLPPEPDPLEGHESALLPDLLATRSLLGELETAPDVEAVLRAAVAWLVREGMGSERAYALVADAESEKLCVRAAASRTPGDDAWRKSARAITVPLDRREDPVAGAWWGVEGTEPADLQGWEAVGVTTLTARAVGLHGRPFAVLAVEPLRGEEVRASATIGSAVGLVGGALQRLVLVAELRQRELETQLFQEATRAALSPINLAEGLARIARAACQALNARGSALWTTDERGESLKLETTFGPAAQRERLARGLERVAAECLASRRLQRVERPTEDARLSAETAGAVSSAVCVPLVAFEHARGVLLVYDCFPRLGNVRGEFAPADVAFLALLADVAAGLLEQARLHEALRAARRKLEDAQGWHRHLERMATLADGALRLAREARHPLASITAFARRAHRGLADERPEREYLEAVVREAERLERLLGEQLRLGAAGRPRWKVESLNQLVQEVIQERSEELVRKRIRLQKKLTPEVPPLLLDRERIKQVFGNVLDHALHAAPAGGRIRLESKRAHPFVVVEVAHDGPRIPGELAEQLFVPFAAARAALPTPGLAVAREIVQRHGGEIRLRTEGEWGTVFSFTLPIHENQDRRATRPDRRSVVGDRRNRFPAG
jgi:signal transduction histidine kinase